MLPLSKRLTEWMRPPGDPPKCWAASEASTPKCWAPNLSQPTASWAVSGLQRHESRQKDGSIESHLIYENGKHFKMEIYSTQHSAVWNDLLELEKQKLFVLKPISHTILQFHGFSARLLYFQFQRFWVVISELYKIKCKCNPKCWTWKACHLIYQSFKIINYEIQHSSLSAAQIQNDLQKVLEFSVLILPM